jgi:hypothetical protein
MGLDAFYQKIGINLNLHYLSNFLNEVYEINFAPQI